MCQKIRDGHMSVSKVRSVEKVNSVKEKMPLLYAAASIQRDSRGRAMSSAESFSISVLEECLKDTDEGRKLSTICGLSPKLVSLLKKRCDEYATAEKNAFEFDNTNPFLKQLCQIGVSLFTMKESPALNSLLASEKLAERSNEKEKSGSRPIFKEDESQIYIRNKITEFNYEFCNLIWSRQDHCGSAFSVALTGLRAGLVEKIVELEKLELQNLSKAYLTGFSLRVPAKVLTEIIENSKNIKLSRSQVLINILHQGRKEARKDAPALKSRAAANEGKSLVAKSGGGSLDCLYRAVSIIMLGGNRRCVFHHAGLSKNHLDELYETIGDSNRYLGGMVRSVKIFRTAKSQSEFGLFLSFYSILTQDPCVDIPTNIDLALLAFEMCNFAISERGGDDILTITLERSLKALTEVRSGFVDVHVCSDCSTLVFEKADNPVKCKSCQSLYNKPFIEKGLVINGSI